MTTISWIKAFEPKQVDHAAPQELYTLGLSPTSLRLRGAVIRFVNTSATAATVSCYAVPKDETAGDTNAVIKEASIAANGFLDVEIPTLTYGDAIYAQAGAASTVTAHFLNGHEIQ